MLSVAGGVAVFIVCQLIQTAYGVGMFSTSYCDAGFLGNLLINVIVCPGSLMTGGLILAGLAKIFGFGGD